MKTENIENYIENATKNFLVDLLKSKSHNSLYLNRYINFIESCKIKNENTTSGHYFENHHILPKAEGWFPEYINLRKHRWNLVKLTARQHLIAHMMLWKAYGKDQFLAVFYMVNNKQTNNKIKKKFLLTKNINSRLYQTIREKYFEWRKGRATYKDETGEKYFLKSDDPLIQELNLVGNNKGYSHNESTKQTMSFRKKKLKLYFLNMKTSIKIDTPDFYERLYEYESQGWSLKKTKFDIAFCNAITVELRKKADEDNSKRLKGKMRYTNQDGVYQGWFDINDPIILENNWKPQWTENNKRQNEERAKKAVERNTGSKAYNNGVQEVKTKEHPGEGWVLGRLPRSSKYINNQREGIRRVRLGKECWNDGLTNFYIAPGTPVQDGWVKGMRPRTARIA